MQVLDDIPNELTLVLTASVDPKSMPGVTRPDARARERDYAAALAYYVTEHPLVRQIVFIENSNWPLDGFEAGVAARNPHGKRVEFVSLNCNDFPRELGKSYGEMLLMDRGLERSKLAAGSRFIAKLTGRNYLMNLSAMLDSMRRARRPFDMWVDLRDHGIYETLGVNACGRHADSRFVVFSPAFYDEWLRGRYEKLNDSTGYMVENLLYDVAKHPDNRDRVVRRFRLEPNYRGLAGHLNKDYSSPKELLKRRIRGTMRRVAPWLHV